MRRALFPLFALALAVALPATDALAQSRGGSNGRSGQSGRGGQSDEQRDAERRARDRRAREWAGPTAVLRVRPNAGPCPYVKVLYDAARYVEFQGPVAAANVGWTGEIEGLSANCVYRNNDPIRVSVNVLFDLGRGPQAQGTSHNYRYWIAVTERNSAVLAKEYFDLPATFQNGTDRVQIGQQITEIVIPRADASVSGAAFEVLVGFDVTPEMAEFNRNGSRFRINAGQTAAPGAAPAQTTPTTPPPAQ